MKTTLLTAVSLIAVGTTLAHAADLPARAYSKAPAMVATISDWSGFYLGVDAGGGSSHNCWTNKSTIPNSPEGCHDATGGLVGGQFGYRWQSAGWVAGLEARGDWANLKGSNVSISVQGAVNQTKVNALGLFTGQVGYAWNNVLLYLRGGAAVTDNKYTGAAAGTGAPLDQASETRWGAAVGTGVEVSFAQNWSLGLEYDHLFLGNRNVTTTTAPVGAFSRTDSVRQDADMGTVHVNYRWGGPVIAKH
jgi:outer membrane immunogenic protein